MKRSLLVLSLAYSVAFGLAEPARALMPEEYAQDVIRKDLSRSLNWLQKISQTLPADSVEVSDLYNSALPLTQKNWQTGISIKGSIERILLLLEGAEFFPSVRAAPVQYLAAKVRVRRVLLAAKDQTDHFKFGEKPEVLYKQWQQLGAGEFADFAQELELVLKETQKLLVLETAPASPSAAPNSIQFFGGTSPKDSESHQTRGDEAENTARTEVVVTGRPSETAVTGDVTDTPATGTATGSATGTATGSATGTATVTDTTEKNKASATTTESDPAAYDDYDRQHGSLQNLAPRPEPIQDFELQRFYSYLESAETGRVAPECEEARVWATDLAPRCSSDDEAGCDRKYARQCKKLH